MRYFIFCISCFMSTLVFALPTENANMISHSELTRVVTGLLLVLLLIVVLSWIVKRLHGVHLSSAKGFQSVATLALGPKERITLLNAGGRYLLLGVGAATVTLLHDFGSELPAGFEVENKPGFADILKSVVGKS